MNKAQALQNFFEGFGLTAYPVTNVPEDAVFPWLSYENTMGCTGDDVSISANLWFHTESEAVPNAKAEEIANAIGLGGVQIPYDNGTIWVTRGTPWALSITETDRTIKRRQLNLNLTFM